jgi:hypothetical protein
VRLRGALIWEADGESHRDEVLVSVEHPNGAAAHVEILDQRGQRRAALPDDLPPGSVLLLPPDADDGDVELVQESGYAVLRDDGVGTDESPEDQRARQAAIAAADAELDDVIARMTRDLRQRHPELFDARGRLRKKLVAQKIRERTGGKRFLTDKEYVELTGGDLGPWRAPSTTDAP